MNQSSFSSIVVSPAVQDFIRRWVTFHRVLWALTLATFFIAWNRGLALLYGLFSLLAALLLISYLLPRWQLRGIRVTRLPVGHLTAGQSGSISYQLTAHGSRYQVALRQRLPFADQIEQHHFFDEFTSVREYCQGDELSRVHWPLSARQEHLVVKMYEKTDRPAMLVVLACHQRFNLGRGERSTFEFAVTIAASMIRWACREGMQCFLATHPDHAPDITIQPFCADLLPFYEHLARLTCDDKHPYAMVAAQAHRRFTQANLIVTFRLAADTTRIVLPPQATHIELEMQDAGFIGEENQQPVLSVGHRREGNRLVYPVQADDKLEDLFR